MKNEASVEEIRWLLITAGRGPKECHLAVAGISKKLIKEASDRGIEVIMIDPSCHGIDQLITASSIVLRLRGMGVDIFTQNWLGSIKWQSQSPIRPSHKRMNWFIAVKSLTLQQDRSMRVIHSDLEIITCRSGGAGGQHVNKTSSAVIATHRPSGLKVRVDATRSQHQNKRIALERIEIGLNHEVKALQDQNKRTHWTLNIEVERGNPVRSFRGPLFKEECP